MKRVIKNSSDLAHLFKVGQKVKCRMGDNIDGYRVYPGTVKEVYSDHIIVNIPEISDHCWFEEGLNLKDVYPEYDVKGGTDMKRVIKSTDSIEQLSNFIESKYVGKRAQVRIEGDPSDWGVDEEEFEEIQDRDGDTGTIHSLAVYNGDEFDDCYWNIEFDDGFMLDAISGYSLSLK